MPAVQPALVVALAAALGPALAAASDCKLKFRVNGISGTLTETLSANQTRSLHRNGLIEALNDGRDDLLLTLENGGLTAIVVAIRDANGQTLLVPPTLFTGQRLKSGLCRPHATLLDTGEALQRLKNPAQTAQQAAATAKQAVDLRNDLVQPQRVNTAVATTTDGLQQQLTDVPTTLNGLLTPSPTTLAQVPQALTSARQAMQRVDGIGPAAAQAFGTATASLRNGLQAQQPCFESHRGQAESRLAQLRSLK